MNSRCIAALLSAALTFACAAESTRQAPPKSVAAAAEPRTAHGYRRNVAVLVFEGVELLDFAGPVEVFTNTRRWDEPLRVYTVGEDRRAVASLNGVTVVPDYGIADCPPPDVLVIPGGEVRCLGPEHPLGRYIAERASEVEIVFSICNGVFALADARLLDGLEATTHWTAIGWLREAAPKTTVRDDVRFVDNGHIVTAAGISAGIDGALHLVDRLLGHECARTTARRMEYEWQGAPTEPEVAIDRVDDARRAWYREDWNAALAGYNAIVAEHPDDDVALARLGTCLLFTKHVDESLVHLERAVQLGSRDRRLYNALGFAFSKVGRHAESVEALTKAQEIDPDSREVEHLLGMEQVAIGRYREALANLERVWARGGGDVRMLGALAIARAGVGDREAALATLSEVAGDDHPDFEKLLADPAFDRLRDDPRFRELGARAAKKNASGC